MPLKPRVSDVPRIRSAVRLYRVSAYITGTMLLLLVAEMILKYTPLQVEIELGGPNGFLALVPDKTVTAVNLSTGILIAHGWLYVLYLFSDFHLWSLMRWPFSRFIVEHFMSRRALHEAAALEAQEPAEALH